MGTNYLLFVVKIFVCALCCANLWFGISISSISKTEQISTLLCNKKISFFFVIWRKKLVFLIRNFFLLLVHVFFSYLSLTVVFSVVAMTRTLAAGHPLASSRLISWFLLLFLFSLSSLLFLTVVFLFVFSFLFHSLFPFCNSSFHLPVFCFIRFFLTFFFPPF